MATKDWKKVRGDLYEIRYRNKKISRDLIVYDNPANNNFDLMIEDGDWYKYDERLIKTFKTKSQALEYAKSYMRKH